MRTVREKARLLALNASRVLLPSVPGEPPPPRRVLAIRPDHLGDLLLSVPALRLIKQTVPDCHLGLLIGPWNSEAAAGIPWVDDVLTLPFPWFDRHPGNGLLAPYRLLQQEARCLTGQWDTAVVLRHDHWWGAMLAARAGIPRRIGYNLPELRPFLTDAVPYEPAHETDQTLLLAQAAVGARHASPLPAEGAPMEFCPSDADHRAATDWLEEHGIVSSFAVIHPGAGAPVKQWGAQKFAAVADALAVEAGVQVVLTGNPAEEDLVSNVMQAAGVRAKPLVGAPLGTVAAVLQRAGLALGVDSGIMHLAAAVGTPTVRLYGPVDPARFGPWGSPERHRVVQAQPLCVPCNRLDLTVSDLPSHPCVRAISVEAVVQAALPLLQARLGALTPTLSQEERESRGNLSQGEREI